MNGDVTTSLIRSIDELPPGIDDASIVPFPTALTSQPIEAGAPATHPTWEYRTVLSATSSEALPKINAAGEEGWELVAVLAPHTASGLTVYYLKRRRLD
jgi:hypothetical protein